MATKILTRISLTPKKILDLVKGRFTDRKSVIKRKLVIDINSKEKFYAVLQFPLISIKFVVGQEISNFNLTLSSQAGDEIQMSIFEIINSFAILINNNFYDYRDAAEAINYLIALGWKMKDGQLLLNEKIAIGVSSWFRFI